MSDMTEQQLEQMSTEPAKPQQLPGQRLREAREAAGLSRGEIALQMHISESKVAELEADNYAALPSAIYVAGYLRSYARILGLPEDDFVLQQDESGSEPSFVPGVGRQAQASSLDLPVRLVTWLIIGVVFISLMTWLVSQRRVDEAQKANVAEMQQETATAVVAEPVPLEENAFPSAEEASPLATETAGEAVPTEGDSEVPATPVTMQAEVETPAAMPVADAVQPDTVAETQTVETTLGSVMQPPADEPLPPPLTDETPQTSLALDYQADCWTEVDDSAGRHLVYGLMREGQSLELKGEAPFKVFLGYAPGATVNYNGELFDHSPYQRGDIARFRVGRADQNQPISR